MTGIPLSCFLLPLFFTISHGEYVAPDAGPRICTVDKTGLLAAFSGSKVKLTLPCKYHLADITCGNYRVKVTPGNAQLTRDMHSTPVTMWVKVVDLETKEYLKIRTSLKRLQRFQEGKASHVWESKEGNLTGLDVMGYDPKSDAIILYKSLVFHAMLTAAGDVSVLCQAEDFTSRPVPDTLCGDGTDNAAQDSVNNLILSDKTVTQSKTCQDMAAKFQTCDVKTEAVKQCDVILKDQRRVQCLSKSDTPLGTYYRDCVTSVCDGEAPSALDTANSFCAREICEGLNYKVLDDYRRDVNYGPGDLCDTELYPRWYRFLVNGTDAMMPATCVSASTKCGGSIPLWSRIPGRQLPAPGTQTSAAACGVGTNSCCDFSYSIHIRNCGDFYVYKLTPPAKCGEVYCAKL